MQTTTSPLLVLLIIICTTFFLTGYALHLQRTDGRSCIPADREALLSFKKGITSDPVNRLTSWHGPDCCRWRGVRCSNETGHVLKLQLGNQNPDINSADGCEDENALFGEISPSLLSLEQLEHIDLSMNCFTERRETIPLFLGSMKRLTYLNLSGIPFSGEVPPQLGNLSNLQYLDLGFDPFSETMNPNIYSTDITWLKNLPTLQYLSMTNVKLSRISDWPHVLNSIPSLKVIKLRYCSLESANQSIPYINLTSLEVLDLLGNDFDHEVASCWFWKVTSLKYLDLRYNRLSGEFDDAFENMASLQFLDLSWNSINNLVPKGNFKNLFSLEILQLTGNWMNGDIAVLMESLSHCVRDILQELHLGYNNLTGAIPNMIGRFTSLIILDLSNNQLSSIVPTELGALADLTSLDLSNNNLSGVITEDIFSGLTSLVKIDISSNSLKIVLDKDWLAPFSLNIAIFTSCQMGPLFPAWLQQQLQITYLDLSISDLMGKIPDWFWPTFSQAIYIDISGNKLSGSLPSHLGDMSFVALNLGSNQFTGPIPPLPRNISILDISNISNNSFSGTLSSDFGGQKLQTLLMYSNEITGTIPGSLCKLNLLIDLDLSSNLLEGEIPQCAEAGFSQNMAYLLLSNNNLSGAFPALHNYKKLQFLDLSWNNFVGRLPAWIGNLTNLQFLRLSHNTFSGKIPDEITNLSQLQYLDLSENNLSSVIPRHLSNLTGMALMNSVKSFRFLMIRPDRGGSGDQLTGQFGETFSIIMKGQLLRYGNGLEYLKSIDLSGNSLTGEIPSGIISLYALINLNLSSNCLSGNIPDKIGAMLSLESLDLSKNKLFGEIPSSISNLTSLSYLNLSYNNLSGRIPAGRQLDTLSAGNPSLMYIGNNGLCGPPLQKICARDDDFVHDNNRSGRQELESMSFYLGLVLGFAAGLLMVFCSLLFKKMWTIAYFQFTDNLYDRIYVFVVVKWALLTRKADAE